MRLNNQLFLTEPFISPYNGAKQKNIYLQILDTFNYDNKHYVKPLFYVTYKKIKNISKLGFSLRLRVLKTKTVNVVK